MTTRRTECKIAPWPKPPSKFLPIVWWKYGHWKVASLMSPTGSMKPRSGCWGLFRDPCVRRSISPLPWASRRMSPAVCWGPYLSGIRLRCCSAMPGPEALYKIGKSARGKVSDSEAISEWVRAVQEFETFLSDEVGGKHALDAIASRVASRSPRPSSRWPTVRRPARAAGNLRGMIAEVGINTCLLLPNPDGETVDRMYISGFVGLRRLRPGLPITVGSRRRQPQSDGASSGSSVAPDKYELPVLLEQFCSTPLPSVTITDAGDYSICQMNGDEVGTAAVCDLFLSHYAPGLYPRLGDSGRAAHGPERPARCSVRADDLRRARPRRPVERQGAGDAAL